MMKIQRHLQKKNFQGIDAEASTIYNIWASGGSSSADGLKLQGWLEQFTDDINNIMNSSGYNTGEKMQATQPLINLYNGVNLRGSDDAATNWQTKLMKEG